MPLQEFATTQASSGSPTSFSNGSVIFAGTNGALSQNNGALFWDSPNTTLKVGPQTAGAQGAIYMFNGSGAQAAPFVISPGYSPFNGVQDDTLSIGYNFSGVAAGNRINTSEPSSFFTLEGHYYDGANHWVEYNWNHVSASGTVKRYWAFAVDRVALTLKGAFMNVTTFQIQDTSAQPFTDTNVTNRTFTVYDASVNPQIILSAATEKYIQAGVIVISGHGGFAKGNTFVGASCGNFTLTGNNCTAIGQSAMLSVTSSTDSTAIGTNALNALQGGTFNTAIGSGALQFVVSGINNTAVGTNALLNNTGDNCVAIGVGAMQTTTAGSVSTAVGTSALLHNVTGTQYCAFGYNALANATGGACSAFGYRCMENNTSPNDNSAFGYEALFTNQTGAANCAFGLFALFSCTNSNNSAFGYNALFNLAGGFNCVAVGLNSGLTITSGNQCTFLGASADATAANCVNSVALGYNVKVSASNMVMLGNSSVTLVVPGGSGNAILGQSGNEWGGLVLKAGNIVTDTTTGTQIGTSSTQKIGHWGVTPVAQYSTTGTSTGFTAGAGTTVTHLSTFTGNTGSSAYTIGDIVRALKLTGIMAA